MADHTETDNPKNNCREQDFKARRRLLKASAAVPLIGTLSPGSALAQTSTQCDAAGAANFPEVVTVDDTALRVQAVYWKAKTGNRDNDLYQVGDEFYDSVSGVEVYPDFKGDGTTPKGYWNEGDRYVLCYVDVGRDPVTNQVDPSKIQITGFYPQQNTFGTAISDSCWDSIGGLQSLVYDHANG